MPDKDDNKACGVCCLIVLLIAGIAYAWIVDQSALLLGAAVIVFILGGVFGYRYWKSSALKRPLSLNSRAESLAAVGRLVGAADCYAKACIASKKVNNQKIETESMESYGRIAKRLILKTMLSDKSDFTFKRMNEIQTMLSGFYKNHNESAVSSSTLLQLHYVDFMLEKVKVGDFDFFTTLALQDEEIGRAFLETLSKAEKLKVADLAFQLGFNPNATLGLLFKGKELHLTDGYVTSDKRNYVSKAHVQNQLSKYLQASPKNRSETSKTSDPTA